MVEEAKANSAEDKKRREEIEVKNEADSLTYQMERRLQESGEKLAVHEKGRIEQLLNDLKGALKDNAPVEKLRTLMSDLAQASASFNNTEQQSTAESTHASSGKSNDNDDIIDAEYTQE
jgi:molecular chaperone DnaK